MGVRVLPSLALLAHSRGTTDDHHGGVVRGRRRAGRRLTDVDGYAPGKKLQCAHTRPGSYVANRVADKISSLADNVYICRSGSVRCRQLFSPLRSPRSPSQAADTQAITAMVRFYIDQHSTELGTPGRVDVKTAAQLVMQIAYGNKNNLSAGMIVAGWDTTQGGSVYGVPLGGTLLRLPFTLGGSGSTYIYGYVDHTYRPGMTRQETEAFVTRCVSLAMARDGSSGGCIRLVTIDAHGATRQLLPSNLVPVGHDELVPPPKPVALAV